MILSSWLAKKTPTLEQSELRLTCHRPFYSRPSSPNRRSRAGQKWFLGMGCLIGAIFGHYFEVPSSKPALQPSVRTATSAMAKPALQPSVHTAISAVAKLVLQPGARTATSAVAKPALQKSVLNTAFSVSGAALSDAEFVSLDGGNYWMGDGLDGQRDAPPHQVRLAPFKVAKYEVTLELWDSVMLWGRDHGYPDLPAASGKARNHPVYGISWGDAVKWCNALSEKEGLTPCYYTETALQNVVREGMAEITNQQVNWKANGYRLPTEAEWEYAARGGLAGRRFPNGDELSQEHANYYGSKDIVYDKSRRTGTAASLMSSLPYTASVGSFPPNGFGLYDMAGNVAEWCWDFYDGPRAPSQQLLNNPHGPESGKTCVLRGGSWRHTAADARCANRLSLPGDMHAPYVGFRLVRGL